jgi:hypothetical protein
MSLTDRVSSRWPEDIPCAHAILADHYGSAEILFVSDIISLNDVELTAVVRANSNDLYPYQRKS